MKYRPPNLIQYATAGVEFITVFGLMVLVGVLLDRRCGTIFVWTIVGAVVGFAGGIYRLVTIAKSLNAGGK